MGGGPSRQTLNYRKNALRRYDRYNSDIQSKINAITPIRDELRQKIDTMNDEIDQLNTDISKLGKTTTSNRKTKPMVWVFLLSRSKSRHRFGYLNYVSYI